MFMNYVIEKIVIAKLILPKLKEALLKLLSYLPFVKSINLGKFETTKDKRID